MKPFIRIDFKVTNANAINNYIVYGCPPPSTFCGFVGKLSKHEIYGFTRLGGVAILLHEYVPHMTKRTFHYLNRGVDNEINSPAIIDTPRCDLCASVIFQAELNDELDYKKYWEESLPYRSRFAGGQIQNNVKVRLFKDRNSMFEKIGCGYTPSLVAEDISSPEKLISVLKSNWGRTPSSIGYRRFGTPTLKIGSRENLKSTYADPITGVLQWETIRKHVRKENSFPLTFWKKTHITDTTVIYKHDSNIQTNK